MTETYGSRTYFEVLYWRDPFDPENDLEYNHGDLCRQVVTRLGAAEQCRDRWRKQGYRAVIHRIERSELHGAR